MKKKQPNGAYDHSGSSFDSFLEEEGIKEEVEAIAVKRRHRSARHLNVGLAYSLVCRAYVLGDRGQPANRLVLRHVAWKPKSALFQVVSRKAAEDSRRRVNA